MKQYYRILNIVHSGRKGERGTAVTDIKYEGVIGCRAAFDTEKLKRDYGLQMFFVPYEHRTYDWWTISSVQRFYHEEEDNILVIETLNSIYYLECLGDKLNYD